MDKVTSNMTYVEHSWDGKTSKKTWFQEVNFKFTIIIWSIWKVELMIHIQSWAFGVKAKAVILTINLLPSHPVLWSKVTQSRGSICFGLGKEICQTKLFQLFFSEAGNPRQIWRMLKGRKSLSLLLGQRLQQKRWMATAAVNYKVDEKLESWRWILFRKSPTMLYMQTVERSWTQDFYSSCPS